MAPENVESPGGAAACAAHPPGRLRWTDPPLVERRALAFNSISYIARLALRRGGRCRFSDPVAVPRCRTRCHRFTLTRLPVPSVLVPIGTVLTEASWGGPRSVGSVPLPRCPHADLRLRAAEDLRLQRARLPRRLASRSPEGLPDTLQRVSVSDGYPSARSDPTPSQLPAPDADSPLPRTTCTARNPVEMAGEPVLSRSRFHVVSGVGWTSDRSRSPLLTAPVRMRCSERCSSKTL